MLQSAISKECQAKNNGEEDQIFHPEIETEKTIVLVQQSAAERAAYVDAGYHLALNAFKIPQKPEDVPAIGVGRVVGLHIAKCI
jgi:hypothetical protein